MLRTMAVSVATVVALTAATSAATLESVNGRVLINGGTGYAPGQPQSALKTGDQVFATNGASARIVYDNGCFEQVAAGQVITVRATIQCASTNTPAASTVGGLTTGAIVGGVTVAAGVTGAAILIARSRSSSSTSSTSVAKPASP